MPVNRIAAIFDTLFQSFDEFLLIDNVAILDQGTVAGQGRIEFIQASLDVKAGGAL